MYIWFSGEGWTALDNKSHSVQYRFLAQEVPGMKTGGGLFWEAIAMKLPGFYPHPGHQLLATTGGQA